MKIYRPDKPQKRLATEIVGFVKSFGQAHELAKRLTLRDWKAQYRQSLLGIAWAFFTPVLNTLVWLFLQKSGIVTIADTGLPFPVYVFSGTMIWSIFTESIQMPLRSTQQARSMLSKINFPKEALLLSGVYKVAGNSMIRFALVGLFFAYYGLFPSLDWLLLPFLLLHLILFGTMVGIWLTPFGMLYHDVGRLLPYVLQGLMYLSPVLYSIPKAGIVMRIMQTNPVTPLVGNIRNAFASNTLFLIEYQLSLGIFMFCFLFLGWAFYRSAMPIIIEKGN